MRLNVDGERDAVDPRSSRETGMAIEAVKTKQRDPFTAASLPLAIGNLFAMNNYDVRYDIHVHGAQIDLAVTAKGDPFAVPMYIEATIEYVTNDKYAKDSTKFLLIRNREPGAKLLCVSSTGFTAGVSERALESGIEALTYDQLFARFEKFAPYVDYALANEETQTLAKAYEEPMFNDSRGVELAGPWLNRWRGYAPDEAKWLIILGEYGTGKTSLTRILQNRWLLEYNANPLSPIPVRIELRNFSRQFDAISLLHHFLDTNRLSHVPVEFMVHLIRTGRVILLLDGYDEMAQFLNARERRACLNALADLASEGAKGILTSRPNYFTENEELNVFEALYRTLEQSSFHLSNIDKAFIASEKSVDDLIERYILNKYERSLQDLNPEQTASLVKRKLGKDVQGQKIVLGILERVFREEGDGTRLALSGKPVIISYLLELVDDLKKDNTAEVISALTEWQVYTLIVDKLMLRDLHRTGMDPNLRRKALQAVALIISARDKVVADESSFNAIIDVEFARELRTLGNEERRSRRVEIFEDLRSSATLTRAANTKDDGWVFSHNSLREFLVAETLLYSLRDRKPIDTAVPITNAMRGFVGSIGTDKLTEIWTALAEIWPLRISQFNLGPYVGLLWEAARRSPGGALASLRQMTGADPENGAVEFSHLTVKDIEFHDDDYPTSIRIDARESVISDSDFSNIDLTGSSFSGCILDNVKFNDCNLANVDFTHAYLFECNVTGASVSGALIKSIERDSSIIVNDRQGLTVSMEGKEAIGYLAFNGAIADQIDDFYILRHHAKFNIVSKIVEKIFDTKLSQLRGLTQRGANSDPPFGRSFVERLASAGWVTINKNDLVSATASGRLEFQRMLDGDYLPPIVAKFLRDYS